MESRKAFLYLLRNLKCGLDMIIKEYGYIEYKDLFQIWDRLGIGDCYENGTEIRRFVRGESRYDRPLKCSYFRNYKFDCIAAENLFGELYKESRYFGIGIDGELEQSRCPEEVIYLILKQHRRIHTPLLDVSTDIYAPLYFACKSHNDIDGQLYLFTYNHNSQSNLKTEFFSARNIETSNGRSNKQSSAFILTHGFEDDKLHFYDISRSEVVADRFLIHNYDKEKILEDLREFLNCRDLDKYFGFSSKSTIDRYMKLFQL